MNKQTLLKAIHATLNLSVNAIDKKLDMKRVNENRDFVTSAYMNLIDLVHTLEISDEE